MGLPFKTEPTNEPKTVKIEDGHGTSIEIPLKGSTTPNEEIAIQEFWASADKASLAQIKTGIVAAFLSHRFNQKISPEEILDQAKTWPMIENLYEFVKKERDQWKPSNVLAEVRGERAKESAFLLAKEYRGVAASRRDLIAQDLWYVFDAIESIPEGFDYSLEEGCFCEIAVSGNTSIAPK